MNRLMDFVDSFIPKNLSKKRKSALKDELCCHILDKVDYYKDIGYDEDASIDKAISDFCTDEEVKNHIYREFEELYSEKTVLSIISFAIIGIINFLCFPLDIWVTSADYNRDPDPAGAFTSFCMIFVVLILIIFARVKKYRKMLISVGIINSLIAAVLFFSFYPQMAAYTIGDNIVYLIDRFTPISMFDTLGMANDGIIITVFWFGFLLVPAFYCFIEAARIKRGVANGIKQPKKKTAIFSAVFLALAIISSLMYPASKEYIDNYPRWFSVYENFISEETEQIFNEIFIGDSYSEVSEKLYSEGYKPIENYRNSLDRLRKKQFDNNVKNFAFADEFEIWFQPDKYIDGNGFIGIKKEDGIITGVGIGDMNKNIYDEKYYNFSCLDSCIDTDIFDVTEYFCSLKKGDDETKIMNRFKNEYGTVYSKKIYLENNVQKSYYRVYCCGTSEGLKDDDQRYIELSFENQKLTNGTMYDKIYIGKEKIITSECVK